jgi:hypothetical protein
MIHIVEHSWTDEELVKYLNNLRVSKRDIISVNIIQKHTERRYQVIYELKGANDYDNQ